MPEIKTRRTEKQRIRKVLSDLGRFYPKFAIQRMGDRIGHVIAANENENPEASKMLSELLASLEKSKQAKKKDDSEKMPSNYGWEKSHEEIMAEKRASRRAGETVTVEVKGTVVESPLAPLAGAVSPSPGGQPGATASVSGATKTTSGGPIPSKK